MYIVLAKKTQMLNATELGELIKSCSCVIFLENDDYEWSAREVTPELVERLRRDEPDDYRHTAYINPLVVEEGPVEMPAGIWAWDTADEIEEEMLEKFKPVTSCNELGILQKKTINVGA